jgi:hypothetical protein
MKEAGFAPQFANAIYAPAASSAGYAGQIMDPILRRFFLSSGTQFKSGATESFAERARSRERCCPGPSVQRWKFRANQGEGTAIGPRSDPTMAKERQSGLETITGALSKAAAEGRPTPLRSGKWPRPSCCGSISGRLCWAAQRFVSRISCSAGGRSIRA